MRIVMTDASSSPLLGYASRTSLEDGVARYVVWYGAHPH